MSSPPDPFDPQPTVDAPPVPAPERAPGTSLRVRFTEGPEEGQTLRIDGRKTLGTSDRCDFRLTDPTVSRRHLILEPGKYGIRIVDPGSKNGTWVSDCCVLDVDLPLGAKFRAGNSWAIVELESSDPPSAPSESVPRDFFGRFVGISPVLQQVYRTLARVSPTDSTVLLEGESGTGKELLAEAIHEHSERSASPFVVVDCGAIAETLIEAELFGHERGAFTGADRAREGAFERAHGGTVFLDELGELPLALQTRLLRVLDRRHIKRLGSERQIDIDVRVIAATNRDLEREVEHGRFRIDLYHRLAVVMVRVPPLRERIEDIGRLAVLFAKQLGADESVLREEVLHRLRAHRWPGNVRELRNYVERLVLLGEPSKEESPAEPTELFLDAAHSGLAFRQARALVLDAFTEQYIGDMLKRHGGNVSKAAEAAGVARRYFYRLKGHA